MVNTSLLELLNKSIMLSIGERRNIFYKETREALSEMLSRGIGPGSGVIAGKIGELCIEEVPIRTNIILRTIERVVIESGAQPFSGLPEMLKKEALKFIPIFLGEFRSIIDNLHIKIIKNNYFEPEFLSPSLNAENKINTEIDLLVLRLHSSLKDKKVSIGRQTIYNIQTQGGIVQTGNGSKVALVSIDSINKEEIIESLNCILKSIIEAYDIEANKKE